MYDENLDENLHSTGAIDLSDGLQDSSTHSESLSSSEDSAPEVWDDTRSTDSQSEVGTSDEKIKDLQTTVCLFLAFFPDLVLYL